MTEVLSVLRVHHEDPRENQREHSQSTPKEPSLWVFTLQDPHMLFRRMTEREKRRKRLLGERK